MAFWSGEKLLIELPNLIKPFNPKQIDCASYALRVGGEAFVTNDRFGTNAPSHPIVSKFRPSPNHTLQIPPGQFAFLLTEENVSVPNNAIALISIKAKFKFKGLINVSGFHVDPGWDGKLIFSVYNAGPNPVIVSDKQELFLIVYADLDQCTTKLYEGSANRRSSIESQLVEGMNSQVFSPMLLQREVNEVKATLSQVRSVGSAFVICSTLILAVSALFATFAPQSLGVILARVIIGAGYDIRPFDNTAKLSLPASDVNQSYTSGSTDGNVKSDKKQAESIIPGPQPTTSSRHATSSGRTRQVHH